jgi:hypothetical protein
MEIVEQRAPQGFRNIDDVIPAKELHELVMRYKPAAGFDRDTVNRPIEIRPRTSVRV